jgi:4-amino-4-deoxy-L-arabinose transferase-like glycosyltransferase
MKKKYSILIILCAILSALALNVINQAANRTTISEKLKLDYAGTGDGYIATALELLHEGKLSDEAHSYFGAVPSSPVYPAFIALAFFLMGEQVWSLWIAQLLVFIATVLLMYALSTRFLEGYWAALPAGLLAAFWGTSVYVFQFNNEIIGMFFIVGFFWSLVRYWEEASGIGAVYVALAAVFLSLLILIKPIFEYFFLVFFIIIFWWAIFQRKNWRQITMQCIVVLIPFLMLVGSWHIRNYLVFGTMTISTGGHALYLHALSTTYPRDTLRGFMVAAVLGNYIADMFVPGYASHPEPSTSIRQVFNKDRFMLKSQGYSEFDLDNQYWRKGLDIIRQHSLIYTAVTPAWFFRLNNIPYYTGGMMENLFVGTYLFLPSGVKVFIIGILWMAWYLFVGISLWSAFRQGWRSWRSQEKSSRQVFILMALFILYTNGMYSLFAHAEVRYAVPMLPFYMLFFVLWIRIITGQWYEKILRGKIS